MVGFDLQHGYDHFIMAEAEREHLGFQWGWWPEGTQPVPGGRFTGRRIPRMYRYRALPFGCKSSPFIFTALMQVVLDYLREMGVEVMGYIDDFWAVCDTREQAERVRLFMLHTFAALGLAVNLEKSTPAPVQQAVVLISPVRWKLLLEGARFCPQTLSPIQLLRFHSHQYSCCCMLLYQIRIWM